MPTIRTLVGPTRTAVFAALLMLACTACTHHAARATTRAAATRSPSVSISDELASTPTEPPAAPSATTTTVVGRFATSDAPSATPVDVSSDPPAAETSDAAMATATPPSDRDECVVRGGDTGVENRDPVFVSAGWGDYPQCQYTAHDAAGYSTNARNWEIRVVHPDESLDFWSTAASPSDPSCGGVGTIEPGDQVSIHLFAGSEGTALGYYLAVGPMYHC